MEQPQVGEQIDDLLLAEVAASRRTVRGEPFQPERFFIPLGVRPSREEHDDLAGECCPGVDELTHACGDGPRFAVTPVLAGVAVVRLVGDHELHRVTEHRIRELGRRGKWLVLVAESTSEKEVDCREHLRARAVVGAKRQQVRGLCTPFAEDLDVGVTEPVDRLELVADGEDLGQLGMRDQVDDLALKAVRVLELVDHDEPEAKPDAVPNLVVVEQHVSRSELEVLEVDGRLTALRSRVLGREAFEQLLEQIAVVRRQLLERQPLDRFPRQLVRRRAGPPRLKGREVDHPRCRRGVGDDPERLRCRSSLVRGRRRVIDEA